MFSPNVRSFIIVLNFFQLKVILFEHSLEEMKAEVKGELADDASGRIKERMKSLREDHLKDLERLYSYHAQDYKREIMDRYLSLEEGQGGDIDGKNLTPAEVRFNVSNLLLAHFCFQTIYYYYRRSITML